MNRIKYSDEVIINAVQTSFSIIDVLGKIGASKTSGSMHMLIKRRILKLGIDTSHFKRINPNTDITKLKYQDILVYNRRNGCRERTLFLRRALLESGVFEICECGQGTLWKNKLLQLEIDHIDEDSLNNIKENLRFICPNCHSQKHVNNKRESTAKMVD